MKKIFVFILLCTSMIIVNGQDSADTVKYWTKSITTSLNFSQASFTNWAAGGVNSVAFNGFIKAFANYNKERHHWSNNIDLEYGLIKTSDIDYMKKLNDKIEFNSQYGYDFTKKLRGIASFNFLTQFTDGFDYTKVINDKGDFLRVSSFMAPGYILFGLGVSYVPVEYFSINVLPLVSKFTIVTIEDLQVQYGNDSAQICKTRLGGQIALNFDKEIFKNVKLQSNAKAFFDYLDKEGYNPVVNWDLAIVMTINKYLAANIGTSLIWDKDVKTTDTNNDGVKDKAKVQFKELFGVGVTFTL